MAGYEPKTRRWNRVEYRTLTELGIFRSGEPVELIDGELLVAEPQGARHYTAVMKTARALEVAIGSGWVVRMQGPIGLDPESEPEPDVAVVPGQVDDYRGAHPSRPALTVEVSESSLEADRSIKGSLYARAGLRDYWVLNLNDGVLEVYREPVADAPAAYGWRYGRPVVLRPPAVTHPLAMPDAAVPVADLLP